MGQKKNSKIILIIIMLLVILMVLTGIAYTYFATDLFKTNKDLFFKYITQIGDEKEGFIDNSLKQYFEKQKTTPYQNEGDIEVEVTAYNTSDQFENVNQMKVTFDGQVDVANNQALQNISLNYSDEVKFPVTYKKVGDTLGIQTDYIGSKYVATKETDNKIIGEENALGKIKEFSAMQLTQEEKEHIKNTYFNQFVQELKEETFSKIEETGAMGYKLTLTNEKIRKIQIKLLETLKNDETTLNKLNEYVKTYNNASKITASSLDNQIRELNNTSEAERETVEITVYQTDKKANRIFIKTNALEASLDKVVTENEAQYNLQWQMKNNNQTDKVALSAKYVGLQARQNITENYQLALESDQIKYEYQYNNNVQFTDSVAIEEFSEDNSMILNNYEEEQVASFMQAVQQRIEEVNKKQMEELGLEEDENPLQYVIPQFGEEFSTLKAIHPNNIDEEEVNTFNQKFENYESTNLQGVTVKGLISTIQLNNETQEEENRKIKEIHFNGEEYEVTDQNLVTIKDEIELETAYRVEFERNENSGLIYRAVINKK
jgi:hypothetical protein